MASSVSFRRGRGTSGPGAIADPTVALARCAPKLKHVIEIFWAACPQFVDLSVFVWWAIEFPW